MSDEAYTEDVMQGTFPQARQRYCAFHLVERFSQKMMHKDTSKPLLKALVYSECSEGTFDEMLAKLEVAEPAFVAFLREHKYLDESELLKWTGMHLNTHFTAGVSSNSLAESFNASF